MGYAFGKQNKKALPTHTVGRAKLHKNVNRLSPRQAGNNPIKQMRLLSLEKEQLLLYYYSPDGLSRTNISQPYSG